jgi:hypothetical protein
MYYVDALMGHAIFDSWSNSYFVGQSIRDVVVGVGRGNIFPINIAGPKITRRCQASLGDPLFRNCYLATEGALGG